MANKLSSQIQVKSNKAKKNSSQIRVKSNKARKMSSQICVKSNIFDLTPIFDLKNALSNNLPTPTPHLSPHLSPHLNYTCISSPDSLPLPRGKAEEDELLMARLRRIAVNQCSTLVGEIMGSSPPLTPYSPYSHTAPRIHLLSPLTHLPSAHSHPPLTSYPPAPHAILLATHPILGENFSPALTPRSTPLEPPATPRV